MANPNLLSILQHTRRAGQLTRKELANQLTVSTSMAGKLVSELIDWGLLREVGRSETDSGRPSDLLSLQPQAGYAIGLDIKAAHQQMVIVNLTGDVVASISEDTQAPDNLNAALDWMDGMIQRTLDSSGLHASQILGVGLGFGLQAIVNPATGVIFSWTETPELAMTWKDIPLRDLLATRLPYPIIRVDDIMRSMGTAEAQYGHNQVQDEDFVFALADAGIGLALMINGVAYVGPLQIGGEIGHTPLTNVKIRCNCGNVGCLETVASTTAILDRIKENLNSSNILSVMREKGKQLTIQQVIEAAITGDKLAYQTLMDAGEYFGMGLAIAVNILGPRRVVVGGALSRSEAYLEAARRSVRLQVLSKASTVVRIEPSRMDELSGARGAATQVLNSLFQSKENNILDLLERKTNR